jgi:hypothetical protein
MTMQPLLAIAAVLAIATGVAHSLLGEILIFRRLRQSSIVPSLPAPPLHGRNVRILWATWHLASVFGWVLAGLLWQLAIAPAVALPASSVLGASAAGFLGGALLVLVGTRGRHPGWVALGAVGILSWAAIGAA